MCVHNIGLYHSLKKKTLKKSFTRMGRIQISNNFPNIYVGGG